MAIRSNQPRIKKVYIVYTETEGASGFEWHSDFDAHIRHLKREHKEFPKAKISTHSTEVDFCESHPLSVTEQVEEFLEKEVW